MTAPTTRRPAKPAKLRKTLGFGFDPAQSPYHFAVVPDRRGDVTIRERFVWEDGAESAAPVAGGPGGASGDPASPVEVAKATLSAYLWGRVAESAANEFNRRLRDDGQATGTWAKSGTLLAPHFGKELTLLAWAVEGQDADPTMVPAMVANWTGLAPEERWWFYTTINATGAHAGHGQDRGWRRAIKIAFAENPVQLPSSALLIGPMPERPPAAKRGRAAAKPEAAPAPDATQGRLGLFDTGSDTG